MSASSSKGPETTADHLCIDIPANQNPTPNNDPRSIISKLCCFKFNLDLSWPQIFKSHFSSRITEDHEQPAEVRLCKAATRGDWKTAEEIEEKYPGILSKVISEDRKETALHIATRFNKAAFVEKLVKKLTIHDLESKNSCGNTALCIATTLGALDVAKSMVNEHKELVRIGGSKNATPVLMAIRYKRKHMLSLLLDAQVQTKVRMELLVAAVSADSYEIALHILKSNESLALERDVNQETPLHIMARKSNAIASKKKTTKWESYIDKNWFRCILKKTARQIKARQMVENMWRAVKSKESTKDKLMHFIQHPSNMLHEAARVGNVEFLEVLLLENPELLRVFDDNGKSMFHVAVENRQEGVFNLIYDMKLFEPDDLLYYFYDEKINLLELAAKRADPIHLDRVSGAVFQIHSELIWFKEVEKIVKLTTGSKQIKKEQTLRELFTEEHRELKEEGEKWVKKTANSCMLVATLIATVVFTAAFTVPGGKNQESGTPILLDHKWFTVFVISDGIALISSSTSILLFLSILTSRGAENDFLFWLPLELVFGLGSLFVSVLSMVMAFGATFFLYYGKDTATLPLLTIGMAILPIFWFCVLQWKLWTHALVSLHATTVSCWLRNCKTSIIKTITRSVSLY